jgi:putative polyhydroxyalkanoate system protein
MAQTQIMRKYPGKSAGEIYTKVDAVMERLAEKLSLEYQKDGDAKTGKVSKMGISGVYAVRDEEVTVDLKFPMLVPGSMRQKVQDDIERKLDGLFG